MNIRTGHRIDRIEAGQVTCTDKNGEKVTFTGDAVVCALGLTSTRGIAEELHKIAPSLKVISIGDTNKPRKIMNATEEGYHAARII